MPLSDTALTPTNISDIVNNPQDTEELSSNPKAESENRTYDYLSILHKEFYTNPALTLLRSYLLATNGTRRTEQNCMQAFREKHKIVFALLFLFDFLLRVAYLGTVFFVVLRGLGVIDCIAMIR